VLNVGAAIERGVSVYVGRHPPEYTGTTVSASVLDSITQSPNFTLLDSTHLGPDGHVQLTWMPFGQSDFAAVTSSASGTALGFRGFNAQCVDTAILVYFVSTRADTPSDEFAVETVLNIEFVPKFSLQYLFDTKTAPGGPSDIASATSRLSQPPLQKIKGFKEKINTGMNLWTELKSIYDSGKKFGKQVLDESSSMAGEGWELFAAKPPPLRPSSQDDEKAPPAPAAIDTRFSWFGRNVGPAGPPSLHPARSSTRPASPRSDYSVV
jgi:hypothetical protein